MPETRAMASHHRSMAVHAPISARPAGDALLDARVGREALRVRPLGNLDWLGSSPRRALEAAAGVLGWPGEILPPVTMSDGLVVPVIMARADAWHARVDEGVGPVVDRTWWRDSFLDGYGNAPAQVIDVVGYLVTDPKLSRARGTCARLRPTAPVAALVPAAPTRRERDTREELMRCDFLGIPVLAADGDLVTQAVGADRWHPHPGPVHFQQRLRSEQLFELALREGYWPEDCDAK